MFGIHRNFPAGGGGSTADATAEQWQILSGETAYIASGKVTGTGYFPAAMDFDGSTGVYDKTYTSSGNKVTVVVRFKVASKTSLQTLVNAIGDANANRIFVMLRASNDATSERQNKLLVLGSNSAGTNRLNIVTNTSYADGNWHTAFIEWDADAGTAQLVVDGASDINTGAAAHLIATATLDSGSSSECYLGAQNTTPSNPTDGIIGFFGMRDVGGLTWSDFMQTDGTPKPLDESTWTEWGAQPLFWNEHGDMVNNLGSAGAMTKTGTINVASAQ